MNQNQAKNIVRVLAVVVWLEALVVMISILFTAMAFLMMSAMGGSKSFTIFIIILSIFMLGLPIFMVSIGFGLWQFRNWARISGIVVHVLALISSIVVVIFYSERTTEYYGFIPTIVQSVIIIAILYFLAFNRDIKKLF